MANMRVHDLAKEFGMQNKELLERLQALGIAAAGNGGELSIGYADSGGAASAQWLVD